MSGDDNMNDDVSRETWAHIQPAQRPHYSVLDKNKIRQTYGISIPWWGEALTRCISELTQF